MEYYLAVKNNVCENFLILLENKYYIIHIYFMHYVFYALYSTYFPNLGANLSIFNNLSNIYATKFIKYLYQTQIEYILEGNIASVVCGW